MKQVFKVGDQVGWNPEAGHVRETIKKMITLEHPPASPDISHSALMRSHTVFEYSGRGRSRLEHPGYWQKQVADDLIFARGLLQANWHPGWMKNRRGFACSPHFLHAYDYTPAIRSWTAEKTAERVKYAG